MGVKEAKTPERELSNPNIILMKKLIMVLVLLTGMFMQAPMHAQKPQRNRVHSRFTPEQRAEIRSKQMALALNLSEAQQKKIRSLRMKQRELRKQLKNDARADHFTRRSKKLDNKLAFRRELASILTPAQMERYQDLRADRSKHARFRKAQRRIKLQHYNHFHRQC